MEIITTGLRKTRKKRLIIRLCKKSTGILTKQNINIKKRRKCVNYV